jgi:hypothetical protein
VNHKSVESDKAQTRGRDAVEIRRGILVVTLVISLSVFGFFAPSRAFAVGTLTLTVTPNPAPLNADLDFSGYETPNPGAGNQINGFVFDGSSCASANFFLATIAGHTDSGGNYDSQSALKASDVGVGSKSIYVKDQVTGAVSPCVSFIVVPSPVTTISNLTYPSQVVLQNGIAQATLTFTLGYSSLPAGDAIISGAGGANSLSAVNGLGASTPDACTSSWSNLSALFAGKAVCVLTPGSASGSEAITLTLKFPSSPQQYSLTLFALMLRPGVNLQYQAVNGSETFQALMITVLAGLPDFRISASPASQNVFEGQVTSFTVHVQGLYGFNSQVSLTVSGAPSGTNPVFSVSSGTPDFDSTLTVIISTTAPVGPVTLTITASGGGQSHQVNLVLIINAAAASSQAAANESSSTPVGSSPGNLIGTLSQSTLLLVGGIIALGVLLAAVVLRRPKPIGPATGTGAVQAADVVYCRHCGAPNPIANEFCEKCGGEP